jgi:hypothetical protein
MTKPKIKNNATADIRRFTGFLAPDGSTHESLKKATDYTRDLKIKAALADFALVTSANPGVTEDERGSTVIYAEDLPIFLLAHKADILAAFAQDVLMRAPRQSRAAAAKVTAEPTATADVPVVKEAAAAPVASACSIDDILAELGPEAEEMTMV